MIETKVIIGRGTELPRVADQFLRRDYDVEHGPTTISLAAGVKTEVKTPLALIQLLYVKVVTSAAEVQVFRNLSPEYWTITDTFMVFEAQSFTRLTLKSNIDAEVRLFLAGA